MSDAKITTRLVSQQDLSPERVEKPAEAAIEWHDFQYKQFGNEPKITFSNLTLAFLAPALVCAHIVVSQYIGIPLIQYCFVGLLTSFVLNYTLIIRRYQLMPYLPIDSYDNSLKLLCLLGVCGILSSLHFGWNGSGGMIFAMCWEQLRGNKMGNYVYFFTTIIVGSLLMEKNYNIMKVVEFIPGLFFGYINSKLYTLKSSSTYCITHQFVFFASIALPVFFPASVLIVPTPLQWVLMLVLGIVMLFTVVIIVKLWQSARVSVSTGILSGILMLATSKYTGAIDYVGAGLIALGIIFLTKKQYFDNQF